MTFTERNKIVNVYPAINATGATVATDIVSMKNYNHATFIISFGTCHTSAATTTNLIAYKGEDVTTCNTAFACQYRAELDATADTLGDLTALAVTGVSLGSGNTEDIGTGGGFLVVEIDASDLAPTVANPYDTVRLGMVWDSQDTQMSIICILSEPRYAQASPPTAITD